MSTEPLRIYTDRACSGNGYKNAEAGVGVYFYPVTTSLKPCFKAIFNQIMLRNFGLYST